MQNEIDDLAAQMVREANAALDAALKAAQEVRA